MHRLPCRQIHGLQTNQQTWQTNPSGVDISTLLHMQPCRQIHGPQTNPHSPVDKSTGRRQIHNAPQAACRQIHHVQTYPHWLVDKSTSLVDKSTICRQIHMGTMGELRNNGVDKSTCRQIHHFQNISAAFPISLWQTNPHYVPINQPIQHQRPGIL